MGTTRRRSHVRRTKSGKTEQVREHRMKTPEGKKYDLSSKEMAHLDKLIRERQRVDREGIGLLSEKPPKRPDAQRPKATPALAALLKADTCTWDMVDAVFDVLNENEKVWVEYARRIIQNARTRKWWERERRRGELKRKNQ